MASELKPINEQLRALPHSQPGAAQAQSFIAQRESFIASEVYNLSLELIAAEQGCAREVHGSILRPETDCGPGAACRPIGNGGGEMKNLNLSLLALLAFSVCLLARAKSAAAQSSGSYVNVCSSGGYFPVESTTCIYGDMSGLTGYVESDMSPGYSGFVIGQVSEVQIYDGSTLLADSGNPNCTSLPIGQDCSGDGGQSSYASASTAQVTSGHTYTVYGSVWEWYDPSNENNPFDAYWTDAGGEQVSAQVIAPQYVQGYINPKYIVLGVTYAPPGPQSSVTYTNSTGVGITNSISSSLSSGTTYSVSITQQVGIGGWKQGTTVGYSNSAEQMTTDGQTTTLNWSVSDTKISHGTPTAVVNGDFTSPVNHDYDVIYVWLNPVVVLSLAPGSVIWNGYGYDATDQNGMDIVQIPLGYLNGHFGPMPSNLLYSMSRSWAANQILRSRAKCGAQ